MALLHAGPSDVAERQQQRELPACALGMAQVRLVQRDNALVLAAVEVAAGHVDVGAADVEPRPRALRQVEAAFEEGDALVHRAGEGPRDAEADGDARRDSLVAAGSLRR